jgi:hypothetical protein
MKRLGTGVSASLVIGAVAFSLGCEQKLTYQRWEMVHQGQTQLGVEKTLGDPLVKMPDQWTWNDSDRSVTAHVWYDREGKVVAKQWFDPKHGMVGAPPGGNVTEGGNVTKQKTTIMTVE